MNKKVVIPIAVVVSLIVIMFIIRSINMSKKKEQAEVDTSTSTTAVEANTETTTEKASETTTEYKPGMGLAGDKNKDDGRVEIITTEATTEVQHYVQENPTYPVSVQIFDHTGVPERNMDGSSCKSYFNATKLSDYGTYWGGDLTDSDFVGGNKYLVGVDQNKDDIEIGDLQSVGWLIDNLPKMNANDAIKFTNLHVIGSLSDSHVALLCSYDWYSAFGMDDTLVMFEDISGTLKTSSFSDGDIFSTTIYKHNIKVVDNVNGKRVVCVQYNVFNR